MRHVVFFATLALYMLVISQNWSVYTGALLAAMWLRYDGRLDAEPLTIGREQAQP